MSVNKAIILGRLGKDPELRYTTAGAAVCRFSVATSDKYVNNAGVTVDNTEWHRIVAWGNQAENANKYLRKGSEIFIEGKIKTTSYEKEGQKHWATDIHVSTMQFIGGRANTNSEGQTPDSNQNSNQGNQNQGNSNRNQLNQNLNNQNQSPEPSFSDFGGNPGDDDIPF